ncbi:MAG: SusC/RagA family TonB-linked outer membrane protein [Chitinophagaceae bacterium]
MRTPTLRALLWLMLSVCSISAFAQGKPTITGTVKDPSGNPLSGVTVREKGTRAGGGITDELGNFLVKADAGATLIISSVGYLTQEVQASNGFVTAILQANNKELSEVVITGFGTKTDTRKLTYSVTQIKGTDLVAANNSNIGNALQGKVAGVTISQGTGGPSSSSRIQIRGNARLNSNTEPLIVLDGILIEPGTSGADSWGSNQDFGNVIKNLNPDDYESITVLKGSAASALYGAKALNGVLLITTKKGRTKKGLGLSVSHTESFDKAYKLLDLQNEFGGGISPTFAKDGQGNDVVDITATYFPNPNGGYSYGPKFDGHLVKDLDGRMVPWVANDPLKDFFETGRYSSTNVAVEAATETGSFRFSYSNLYNTSVVPNNSFNKNAFTLRVTQKLSKALSMDASVNYTIGDVRNPINQGGNNNPVFTFVYNAPRSAPIAYYKTHYIDPVNGGILKSAVAADPYYFAHSLYYGLYQNNVSRKENNLLANLDLKAQILPWLNFLLRTNVNAYNDITENKQNGTGAGFTGGSYSLGQSAYKNTRVQGLLTAAKDINKDFSFSATIGGESYNNLGGPNSNSTTNGGLNTPSLYFIGNSLNAATTTVGVIPKKRLNAVYAYGDITWRNMLTLNASVRNDWSSSLTYADGHGTYTYAYPSVGLGWVFTELPSFANSKLSSIISFGKLRASLGYTGYDADPYSTNSTGLYGQIGSFNGANNTNTSIYTFNGNTLGNQNLKNELGREIELGAEMRFLNNRVGFDVTYYKKNSFNQILGLSVNQEAGVSNRNINAGNIQNSGIELLITAQPVKSKNFNWNMTYNFTRNRNKVIELYPGTESYQLELGFGADVAAYAYPGKEYGTLTTGYGFGYYQAKDGSGNNVANANNGKRVIGAAPNGSTGDYYTFLRSQDYDGSKRDLGTIMPDFLAGTIQEVSYKNLSLSVQVDSKVGGLMGSATSQYGMETGNGKATLFGRDTEHGGLTFTDKNGLTRNDGIIPDGVFAAGVTGTTTAGAGKDLGGMSYKDAFTAGFVTPVPAYAYYENLTQWSSGIREASIFENSWVALRQVSLGYTIPTRSLGKVPISNLRVSVTGRNLFYIYKSAKDGVNPEGMYSNRAAAFMEYGGLPLIRSFGATINASF